VSEDQIQAALEGLQTEPQPQEPATKVVLLRTKYGPCFPGERAGYPANIADTLVANGDAFAIGPDDQPIIPMDEAAPPVLEQVEDNTADNEPSQPAKTNRRKPAASKDASSKDSATKPSTVTTKTTDADEESLRPFVIDGLDKSIAALLVANGLTTPESVTQALAEGRDLDAEIQGIGPVSFAQIKDLYAE